MGVTIYNKNNSIDMGYFGFERLRITIAECIDADFGKVFRSDVDTVNNKLQQLYGDGILTDADDVVIDFLYDSDCAGKLSANGCKRLWNYIKDYDDNVIYGYAGRPDRAMFKDFKEIVNDCAKKRLVMRWS